MLCVLDYNTHQLVRYIYIDNIYIYIDNIYVYIYIDNIYTYI